ncbi:MAG: thioredoxin family protein [Ignavibacteria bacterium]|nr:thioredoxin family protein [Ignavibacteria bacterium]
MSMIFLNKNNFDSVTGEEGIAMIDVWAEWCDACRKFDPIFNKVADKYPEYVFAKIDATKEKELISSLGIENIPALLLYRDGILLFQQPGYYEKDKLEDIIKQAAGLNMDEVRADISAENS